MLGTYNSLNKSFHLVSFECLYSTSCLPIQNGFIGKYYPVLTCITMIKMLCAIDSSLFKVVFVGSLPLLFHPLSFYIAICPK